MGAAASSVLIGVAGRASAQEFDPQAPFDEIQRGDIDAPEETVRVDPVAVSLLANAAGRAVFNERDPDFPAKLVSTAARFVGMNRSDNEAEITSLLDMFDLPFKDKNDQPIPYCACGLSYAAALAYQEFWNPTSASTAISALRESMPELDRFHFYPTPSVRDMYHVALGKRRWIEAGSRAPKPGYVVVFAFGSAPNHCGILESVDGARINTIEFNTTSGAGGSGSERDGGKIVRRNRPMNASVKGFIATDLKV
jgi:hypothetical protein